MSTFLAFAFQYFRQAARVNSTRWSQSSTPSLLVVAASARHPAMNPTQQIVKTEPGLKVNCLPPLQHSAQFSSCSFHSHTFCWNCSPRSHVHLFQAEVGTPTASGLDGGLAHVVGAKRTDIPRELYVLLVFVLDPELFFPLTRRSSSYPRLQNCVATVDLDTKLNLREIVQSVNNAEYVWGLFCCRG